MQWGWQVSKLIALSCTTFCCLSFRVCFWLFLLSSKASNEAESPKRQTGNLNGSLWNDMWWSLTGDHQLGHAVVISLVWLHCSLAEERQHPRWSRCASQGHWFGFLCGLIKVTLLMSMHLHRLRKFFPFPVSALICVMFEFPHVSCVFLLFNIPGGVALFFLRLGLAFSWALLVWLDLNSCLLPSDSVCLCCTVLHRFLRIWPWPCLPQQSLSDFE